MHKSKNIKLDLQLHAPVKTMDFDPDNVMVHELPDGTIPQKYNDLIIDGVMETSRIMQLGRYEPMAGTEKKFTYFAEGPGAYWVGEGQKIQTSKPTYIDVTMTAKKLGVILLASREYLDYTYADFFEEMLPKIREAFQVKFDNAGILNQDNPFPQSIEESVIAAGNVITGPLTYDNVLDLEDLVNEESMDVNAFISTKRNRKELRTASQIVGNTTELIYDRAAETIDGSPVVDLKALPKGDLYGGDFDMLFYGIPHPISFEISTNATISTVKNEDGSDVNLFEQELIALRATMDVGLMIVKDEAFAKITAGE